VKNYHSLFDAVYQEVIQNDKLRLNGNKISNTYLNYMFINGVKTRLIGLSMKNCLSDLEQWKNDKIKQISPDCTTDCLDKIMKHFNELVDVTNLCYQIPSRKVCKDIINSSEIKLCFEKLKISSNSFEPKDIIYCNTCNPIYI
jgi:hypothetical protein